MRKYAIAVPFLLPAFAAAQNAAGTAATTAQVDDRWTLGVAAAMRDSPYAGEGTRVRPLPLVTYAGDRLFWSGLSGGVHLVKGETFSFDVLLSGRFDGFDIDDLGRTELAANGIDAALLEDRDDGADLGLAASWKGRAGELKLRALADISDASGGYELAADYAYAMRWGSLTVAPGAGLRWQSADLVDYYYGTLDEEVARGVRRYRPGSALIPQVAVGFALPLGRRWTLSGAVDYKFLPSEITDSPLIEPDTDGSAGLRIGISRGF